MKALELNILNRLAPYEVALRDGEYYFHTDFDIEYSVEFKYEPAFGGTPAYWFDLTNRSGKASPTKKISYRAVELPLTAAPSVASDQKSTTPRRGNEHVAQGSALGVKGRQASP